MVTDKQKRNTLTASGFAHFIHDGLTDCQYIFLPLWAEVFGLSHAQVGLVKMCSSGALAFFQIPAGFLAEKFSDKSILSIGTAFAGVGLILTAFATGYVSLLIAILILGTGAATQHPLASTLVSQAYRSGRARAALGIYNFTGDMGKVVVPVGIAAIIHFWGWQQGAIVYGTIMVFSAPLLFVLIGNLAKTAKSNSTQINKFKGWGITDRSGFSVLAISSMIDMSCRSAFLTFMPFLLISKGVDGALIGVALGLVFAGGATGKLVCGLIAEKVGIIKTIVITEALTGILIIALVYGNTPWIWGILPVLGLALNGTSSVLYGTIGDFVDADQLPRVYGLFYTLVIGAGAVAPLFYGFVSDAHGIEMTLILIGSSVFLVFPLCGLLKPALERVGVA
jgi:FSR family fosmidomycin resistance protein-like MFS transporter